LYVWKIMMRDASMSMLMCPWKVFASHWLDTAKEILAKRRILIPALSELSQGSDMEVQLLVQMSSGTAKRQNALRCSYSNQTGIVLRLLRPS